MGYRYNLDERILGGSCEPRLGPSFDGDRLNTNLGPRHQTPLVRETSSGCLYEPNAGRRRGLIGLSRRFHGGDT